MTRAVFLFVVLLAGCAPQARDITLANVDLRNMQIVGPMSAWIACHSQRNCLNSEPACIASPICTNVWHHHLDWG